MNPTYVPPLKHIIAFNVLFSEDTDKYDDASKKFCETVMLPKLWFDLKFDHCEGSLGLQNQMLKIEQMPGNLKPSDYFRRLTALFSSRFELAGVDLKGRIPLSCIEYKQLQEAQQQWEDAALSAVWDAQDFDCSIKAKRDWLKAKINKPLLDPIPALCLPGLELKAIPYEIIYFKNLTSINFASNQFTVLPECLGTLIRLENLMLNDNLLISLPEFVGNLPQLKNAYFSRNRITDLPPKCFAKCRALTNVDLSDNQIAGPLSKCFAKCALLATIDLRSNQITAVPPGSFAHCFQLHVVDLNENPVKFKI